MNYKQMPKVVMPTRAPKAKRPTKREIKLDAIRHPVTGGKVAYTTQDAALSPLPEWRLYRGKEGA